MAEEQLKQCTMCKCFLNIDNFRIKNNKFKTLFSYCKTCEKEYSKFYREKNKEKLSILKSEYYFKNKEDISLKQKQYKIENRERILCIKKISGAKYREKNKEKIATQRKIYSKTLSCNVSKKNYKHKRRTIENDGDLTHKELFLLQKNVNKCYWCSNKIHGNKYHIDHYIPLSKGGEHTLSNLVISCPTCNLKKNAKDPIEFAHSIGKLL